MSVKTLPISLQANKAEKLLLRRRRNEFIKVCFRDRNNKYSTKAGVCFANCFTIPEIYLLIGNFGDSAMQKILSDIIHHPRFRRYYSSVSESGKTIGIKSTLGANARYFALSLLRALPESGARYSGYIQAYEKTKNVPFSLWCAMGLLSMRHFSTDTYSTSYSVATSHSFLSRDYPLAGMALIKKAHPSLLKGERTVRQIVFGNYVYPNMLRRETHNTITNETMSLLDKSFVSALLEQERARTREESLEKAINYCWKVWKSLKITKEGILCVEL